MPKLSSIPGYYEPITFIIETHTKEKLTKEELNEYLIKAYRDAIRKILLASPQSFGGSLIFDLCIEVILYHNNLTEVTAKWIDDQINNNKELSKLKKLKPDDPDFEKFQLIKAVTKAHQCNLAIHKNIVPFVNSTLALDDVLKVKLQQRKYKYPVFTSLQKEDSSKRKEAIETLRKALCEKPVDLLPHLSTLSDSDLGKAIKIFIKEGQAENLLSVKKILTVSEFITALNQQVNSNSPICLEKTALVNAFF